jgi:hypothetical protein
VCADEDEEEEEEKEEEDEDEDEKDDTVLEDELEGDFRAETIAAGSSS